MWDSIVLNPDHCLSVYFTTRKHLITPFAFLGGGREGRDFMPVFLKYFRF